MTEITFKLNGAGTVVRVEDRTLLSDALREEAGAIDVHVGCEHGVCGLCTVIVDGVSVRSCLMFAVQAEGAEIETVRGLAPEGELTDLQQAFIENHALQCGFCTPAMLLAGTELLAESLELDDARIRDAISGIICRCTGYRGIVAAIAQTAARRRGVGQDASGSVEPTR